jgi:hypothetical protein
MDQWGIAGPPKPEARKAMGGDPDPGWIEENAEVYFGTK